MEKINHPYITRFCFFIRKKIPTIIAAIIKIHNPESIGTQGGAQHGGFPPPGGLGGPPPPGPGMPNNNLSNMAIAIIVTVQTSFI